ncbi:MAG: TonB-dependent receptor [Gemmatimonadetes bacterium]|nr:TonB-dependent receptor [Gemmatimonadota bacterium]
MRLGPGFTGRLGMRRSFLSGCVVALVLLPAVSSGAQQRDTLRTDTMVFRIPEIRVTARRAVTTVGGASAVEVTLDSLILPPAPTVEEVLRELPGMHVRTNSRGEAEISVRGSESRQVAVLVDGVPITLGWDARTDVSVLPAAAPHEVNLVRGLSSVLYGPNVLGGAVEMSVARGFNFPSSSSAQATAGFDGEGGYGTTASVSIPEVTGGGQLLFRAGAGFRDSPGAPLAQGVVEPVAGDDGLRLNTDTRNLDGFLALRYVRDGGGWVTLSGIGFQGERGIAGELGVKSPRLWRYPHIARTIAVASAGTGDRVTPLGRGDMELGVGLDRGRTEITSYTDRTYSVASGTENGDSRTTTVRLLADHTLGPRGDLKAAATWADIRQDMDVSGVESAYRQRLSSYGLESVWRLVERKEGALQAIRLSFGGALDHGDTPETGGLPAMDPMDDWGARLGLTALAGEGKTLLHAGVSRRGRFPALREVYSEALNRFEPNPDLHPERLVAFEGGVTTRLGNGELQVVGFHHQITDAIRRITLANKKRKRVNSDELNSTGVEVLFSQAVRSAEIGGDLMLQSVELVDPANPVSRRAENLPERSGGAYVRLPLVAGLTATGEARYTGVQFCQHPDTGADVELKGGTLFGADVGRSWNVRGSRGGVFSRLEARAAVDNLADKALYDQCGLPRAGRLLRLQLRLF